MIQVDSSSEYIFLKQLRVQCIIGIFKWERTQKQTVAIDLKIPWNIHLAASHDEIQYALNYKKIAKSILAFVSKSRYYLVETLAESLAQHLLINFHLPQLTLRISKLQAIRGSQDVGIEITQKNKSSSLYLGIGSNLQPQFHLHRALQQLHKIFFLKKISHVYETSPVGFRSQPYFWNLVVETGFVFPRFKIQRWIAQIEKKAGRVRHVNKNAPRTLDIDILASSSLEYPLDPHPDILSKAFVFFPLLEISPNFFHASEQKTLIELASQFHQPHQSIRRLPSSTMDPFIPTAD
jgi:dihydroneopterin aldolase